MPLGMGFGELVLILVIVVVVFGATKLPRLGDSLGNHMKSFRESLDDAEPPRLLLQRRGPRRWSIFDRLLVIAAVGLAAAVIANAALRVAR
jgi:sec-independent protein translocase protein TatA